ncbi:putative RNA-directed DNA polymerase, eukaryota, reverse transcriptase zinc-binding domain protein [Tanacetum coccineum]
MWSDSFTSSSSLATSLKVAWYRKCKKGFMVFKVDFEKAFDSLGWDFLDSVMGKLGFRSKWRFWIHGCFSNARSPVLVNGPPTFEFEIFIGLRQGGPLSHFLFILAMDGLHALTCKAEELGLIKGVTFGRDNMHVSHLMYADDVIFIEEWSWINVYNLICMLRCFFLISELKINIHKSNVLGVCVSDMDVTNMANLIGCGAAKFPLKYLGVLVGCNIARCFNWKAIIQKFSSKLSLWKARLFSVGDHLTLTKLVLGNLPTYYMSLYMMLVHVQQKLESIRNNFFIRADQGEKKTSTNRHASVTHFSVKLFIRCSRMIKKLSSFLHIHIKSPTGIVVASKVSVGHYAKD